MAELKIKADSGGGTVSFKGPATTTSNAAVQLTLPVDDGAADQYLKTNGSGVLSWATVDTSIADDSIAEAKLDVSNAPTNGQFLQAQSGEGGGLTWADAGGGKLLAYGTHTQSSQYTITSSDTWQTGVHSVTITPTKASSKILILLSSHAKTAAEANHGVYCQSRFNRNVASGGASVIWTENGVLLNYINSSASINRLELYGPLYPSHIIDTPTYTLGQSIEYTYDFGYWGNVGGDNAIIWNDGNKSRMTVMELD